MKICNIKDCHNTSESRGWCNKHYQRWIRYGDAYHSVRPTHIDKTTICSVSGCNQFIKSGRGLCNSHYMKWWRHGDPNFKMPEGVYNTTTYKIWTGMKQRCDNPNTIHYDKYGGSGITYDRKWRHFKGFLEDMGERPDGLSLDRRDNNGNYTKENCRWATPKTQMNNRRNNIIIEYDGRAQTMSQWEEELRLPVNTLYMRIRKAGWSIDRALSTPLKIYKNTRAT